MEWELLIRERRKEDPYGLNGFLRRLQDECGGGDQLSGFTFLQDAREMLTFSRNIEQTMLASGSRGPLYVGFQTAAKLEGEIERYRYMFEHHVKTCGYGTGTPDAGAQGVVSKWTALSEQHAALENQWFLVVHEPEPIAFVGWEVSDRAVWGDGGITAPGKVFVGFVSDEIRLVEAIIGHLEGIRPDDQQGLDSGIVRSLNGVEPKRTMIIVDDCKRPFLKRAFDAAIGGAFGGSKLYLYDLSAASYLVSPYPSNEVQWRQPQSPRSLRQAFGRSYLADLIDELGNRGIAAEAVLPEGVGFKRMGELSDELNIDVVVMPEEFIQPGLIDRLRGNTLAALGAPRARVIVERASMAQSRPALAALTA